VVRGVCPDVGWVDFDPTNNLLPAEEHITVAFGRDYSDVIRSAASSPAAACTKSKFPWMWKKSDYNLMKFEIIHRTIYLYASPVRDSFNEARLQPFSNATQTVDSFFLKVLPAARLQHHHDFYSNTIHHFEIVEPHSTLLIESHLRVSTRLPARPAKTDAPWPLARIGEAVREPRIF